MSIATTLNHDTWDLANLQLKRRLLDDAAVALPVFRKMRFASRENLETFFDRLASQSQWHPLRTHTASLLLMAGDAVVTAEGTRKSDYCSCNFDIWASSVDRANQIRTSIEALAGPSIMHDPMFSIDWHFLTGKGDLQSAAIEERADDVLLDSAYPEIVGGVDAFIDDYLASDESILVIQGPPGTGKTRLIRKILGAMTQRKGETARALYTGDTRTAESDEIFVKFITGWDDAFVIEDADHLLKPRANGNEHLHRFLTIADGVVRSQGRKIVFSTNLPNIRDLDDALIRPGRCYARLNCRELRHAEAQQVLTELCGDDQARLQAALGTLATETARSIALAAVYKLAGRKL